MSHESGFFTAHETAVVAAAAARLVPGPADDPAEAGHPGAREADVVHYIDTTLAALRSGPPRVHAGGPWSDRQAAGPNHLAGFIPPGPATRIAWERRLAAWQGRYRDGIAQLDVLADGDFTAASLAVQDEILASSAAADFVDLLFSHAIEGMYANPEYGGNRGLAGWADIGFPGDVQPRGYRDEEVERSDGYDPIERTAILDELIAKLRIDWTPD
jgi:Gluconate 2-dehydrogenase subunit 3